MTTSQRFYSHLRELKGQKLDRIAGVGIGNSDFVTNGLPVAVVILDTESALKHNLIESPIVAEIDVKDSG